MESEADVSRVRVSRFFSWLVIFLQNLCIESPTAYLMGGCLVSFTLPCKTRKSMEPFIFYDSKRQENQVVRLIVSDTLVYSSCSVTLNRNDL